MSEATLRALTSDTVRLIGSSQVITSVFSVVKELIENSLDAGSTTIDIKLEDYGLDKVEVRDNGHGISQSNLSLVAKRYHTSKISSFSDLDKLSTYGFRGEALGSLCTICDLSVTSKICQEDISHTVALDHHGNIVTTLPSHLGQGTTITASKLFNNLPVRRQYYNTMKKKKEELKKVEDLVLAYGAIRPDVRLLLKNNKDIIWQKSVVADTRIALLGILGNKVLSQLEYKRFISDEPKITIEAFLPSPGSEITVTSRSSSDRGFIAVNGRPIQNKDMEKCVKQHYCHHSNCEGRYPIYVLHICLPSNELDVNVDPNKTRVFLHQQKEILAVIKRELEDLYGPIHKTSEGPGVKQAATDSDLDDKMNSSVLSADSSFDKTIDETLEVRVHQIKSVYKPLSSRTENVSSFKCDINNKYTGSNSGLKISFYQGQENGLVNEQSATISDKVSVKCDTDRLTVDDALSHIDKGDFSIISADLDDLLSTQNTQSEETIPDGSSNNDETSGTDVIPGATKVNTGTEDLSESAKSDIADVYSKMFDDSFDEAVVGSFTGVKEVDKSPSKDDSVGVNKNMSVLEWSRGRCEKSADGQVLQPVTVLTSGKRGLSHDSDEEEEKEKLAGGPPFKKRLSMDQPSLYEMVSRSPGEKSAFGFVAFSREIRPQVLASHPKAAYNEITQLVKDRWNKLSDEERSMFREMGSSQAQVLQKKIMEKKRLVQKTDNRIVPVKGIPTIKDQLLSANRKVTGVSSIPQKCVKVPFSLDHLRKVYNSGPRFSQTQESNTLKLIGPLKFYNGWVCYHGDTLSVINPHRAEEVLVHRGLMESHVIPATKLEEPIRLDQRLLGDEMYSKVLTSLLPQDNRQTYMYIDDERLTANGIQIRCHLNESSSPLFDLVSRATCMPTYGISDMKEVLDLIHNSSTSQLVDCRPLKVKFYLQGEAVRMVRQRPLQRNRDDIMNILEQLVDLTEISPMCLHNKPIQSVLIDLSEIADSQASLLEKTFC